MLRMKAKADKEEYYKFYFDNLNDTLGLVNLMNPMKDFNSKN
jgi:hypothetical protein